MAAQPNIPFFRYSTSYISYEEELLAVVSDIMGRGAFILQADLRRFEQHFAHFVNARFAVGVGNATDAMTLILRALTIGPGDEVILPSHTFVATAAAVHNTGATPVLVDCGPDHLVDPKAMDAAVTRRTRALMPVDLNGRTCDMASIMDIARINDLLVIEDAAQALGSTFRDRHAGTFGVAGAFSFYPAKLLGCFGDGGAVVTDDPGLARSLSLMRDHGRDETGTTVMWGVNSRLDNLQAAILDRRLARLNEDIERRRALARLYEDRLKGVDEVVLPPGPETDDDHFDVFQNYEVEADDRDELRTHLGKKGIGTILPWGGKAVHQFPELGLKADLPATDALFRRVLLLPMNPAVTDVELDTICDAVRGFYASR